MNPEMLFSLTVFTLIVPGAGLVMLQLLLLVFFPPIVVIGGGESGAGAFSVLEWFRRVHRGWGVAALVPVVAIATIYAIFGVVDGGLMFGCATWGVAGLLFEVLATIGRLLGWKLDRTRTTWEPATT